MADSDNRPAEGANSGNQANSMNPGFGLGLSICRSLTTLLGGKIYLDTQYTGGARFVVELPLHPPV